MYRFIHRTVVFIAVAAASAAPSCALAQTATSSVHIELTVSHWPAESGRRFSPKNFVLSQGGQPFRFHLTQPEDKPKSPVHVLLLSGSQAAAAIGAAAVPQLSGAWARGWLVSIAGSDRTTPYAASEAELDAALQSASLAHTSSGAALQQLESFAGRRMLVLADTSGLTPPPSATTRSIPEVYVVDRGVRTGRTFDPIYLFGPCNSGGTGIAAPQSCGGDTPYAFLGNPELSPAVETEDRGNGFRHGVWHGLTLAAAVKEMFRQSDRYFDLQADVPTATPGSSLDLQFHKLPGGLRLKADAYTETAGMRSAEPRLVLSQQ